MYMGIFDGASSFITSRFKKSSNGSDVKNIINDSISEEHPTPINKIKKNKIRGKVPSRTQHQILVSNGMTDNEIASYLIQKITLVQEGKDKRLNQSSNKVENWTLVHRETGELKEVYIR
jgi:hypothetical protein